MSVMAGSLQTEFAGTARTLNALRGHALQAQRTIVRILAESGKDKNAAR